MYKKVLFRSFEMDELIKEYVNKYGGFSKDELKQFYNERKKRVQEYGIENLSPRQRELEKRRFKRRDKIQADSEVLNRADVTILNGDFELTANEMRDGLNFFYFDPPYRPLNATSSFNSYAKEDFNDDEQIRLRDFCTRLNELPNVKWMLSNADCSAKNPEDTFFETIYANYNIHRVYASRAINANPEKRGKLTELLIKNYE